MHGALADELISQAESATSANDRSRVIFQLEAKKKILKKSGITRPSSWGPSITPRTRLIDLAWR
jgi:hypothetical protein